jgi:hypothetical protein
MSLSSKARAFLKTALGDNTANNEIKGLLDTISGAAASVAFTIGAESGNARTITAQLKDAAGNALAERATVELHVCADSAGAALATTGGSTGIAASTNTYLSAILAKKVFTVTSSATGLITVTWTDTGDEAVYLVVVLPNGKRSVSAIVQNAL